MVRIAEKLKIITTDSSRDGQEMVMKMMPYCRDICEIEMEGDISVLGIHTTYHLRMGDNLLLQ
jgi:hypothetical protein